MAEIEIRALTAPDEESIETGQAQADAQALSAAITAVDRKASTSVRIRKAEGLAKILLGQWHLSPLAGATLGGLATGLGGWLTGRAGRKVSLKIGDTEATASSIDEVRKLLELAEEHRRRNEEAPRG